MCYKKFKRKDKAKSLGVGSPDILHEKMSHSIAFVLVKKTAKPKRKSSLLSGAQRRGRRRSRSRNKDIPRQPQPRASPARSHAHTNERFPGCGSHSNSPPNLRSVAGFSLSSVLYFMFLFLLAWVVLVMGFWCFWGWFPSLSSSRGLPLLRLSLRQSPRAPKPPPGPPKPTKTKEKAKKHCLGGFPWLFLGFPWLS